MYVGGAKGSALIDANGRPGLEEVTTKIGNRLAGWGLTPDWITVFGVVLAIPVVWLLATGHIAIAFVFAMAGSFMDMFDGAVAKARGGGTRRGAFLDAVSDRIVDSLYFTGLALYLMQQSTTLAMLSMVCLAASLIVSYLRAKAAEYGFDAHVGIMERGERLLLLGVGLLLQNWWNVLPAVMWILLALTVVTIVQRFVVVWRQGAVEPPLPIEDARVLPEWKELRTQFSENSSEDLRMTESVRQVWESQRAEWAERRVQARARRLHARRERREVADRFTADRRSSRTGAGSTRTRQRRDRRSRP